MACRPIVGSTPCDRGADPTRAADVADAMRELARERFLPPEQRARADEDRPLPLWHGQTSSQPSTVATMLRLLQVPVGARVLDVGSGSGWTTALLARLVGPGGSVLGLELDPELAAWGADNLAACDLPWARIERGGPRVARSARRRRLGPDPRLRGAAAAARGAGRPARRRRAPGDPGALDDAPRGAPRPDARRSPRTGRTRSCRCAESAESPDETVFLLQRMTNGVPASNVRRACVDM